MTDAEVTRIADAAEGWARDAIVARLVRRLDALGRSHARARVPRDWRDCEGPPCTGGSA